MKRLMLLLAVVCSGVLLASSMTLGNGGYPMIDDTKVQTQTLTVEQVGEMQRLLALHGFGVGKTYGIINEETQTALRQFQDANGLTVTSTPTEETLRALSPDPEQMEFFGLAPEYGGWEYDNSGCCP